MELIVVLVTVAGLFLWNIAESKSATKHLDAKMESFQVESRSNIATLQTEVQSEIKHLERKIDNFITAIHQETRDFHGRLSVIEERNKDRK